MNPLRIRLTLVFATCTAASLAPCAALAQAAEAKSPHTFTGNVAVVSDYRFRGISQTYKAPALQGGFDYAHDSGFYLGTWLSSVSGNLYPNGASLEADVYGGFKWEPVAGLGLDVGVLKYLYPGARYYTNGIGLPHPNGAATPVGTSGEKFDNTEVYIGASYQWFSAKYSHAVSDYFGINSKTWGGVTGYNGNGTATTDCPADGTTCNRNPGGSKGSGYLDLNANFEIMDKTTLGLHAGSLKVKNYRGFNYTDYKVSIAREFPWATVSAAYVTTDAKSQFYRYGPQCLYNGNCTNLKDPGRGTVVLSVSKTF